MSRFVVVGLGNFGSSVAESLYSHGHNVIAVDTDAEAVDRIASRSSRAVVGDGRQIDTLEEIKAVLSAYHFMKASAVLSGIPTAKSDLHVVLEKRF